MTAAQTAGPAPLRFGVLCNSLVLEQWQTETIALLTEAGHRLELVVVNAETVPPEPLLKKLFTYRYNRLIFNLWNRFVFRPEVKKTCSFEQLTANAVTMKCIPVKKGIANYFAAEDLTKMREKRLDFMLRFGFNIIRGEILQTTTYGIWSFHHDDEEVVRGGPPGFWEVFKPMVANGVILQQLTDSLDKGVVLRQGYYKTIRHSYTAHLNQLYNESRHYPLQVCRDIQLGCLNPVLSESKAKIFHPPGNLTMIWFYLMMGFRRVFFHLNDLFRHEDWNIGVIFHSREAVIDNPDESTQCIKWLRKSSHSSYLADPFIYKDERQNLLFFEHYDYRKGKGEIQVADENIGFEHYRPSLETKAHLSFPYLIPFEGQLYCIPESFESDNISLYRYDPVTYTLHFECILLQHVRAVDPVLFQHDGRWWLMFTTKDLPSVNLYAMYAERLTGPFFAHNNNPIKSDIRSARPAGQLFYHHGKLIRPAQDCAKDYGVAVVLNEIQALDPDRFVETNFQRITPIQKSKYNKGLHTFNGNEDYTVIDGKRFVFSLAGFNAKLREKLKLK
ncbi:MAG: hypothetical protein KKD74_13440 [Bacteroidetes bacterium]|nr:hypothetical protein [Bacteroidota bacterium]